MFKTLKKYSFLSILTALIVANNIIQFTPSFDIAYYCFMAVVLCIVILKGGVGIKSWAMILLYAFCALSIVFNTIPVYFKAPLRLVSFLIVSMVAAPGISSKFIDKFRCDTFTLLQYFMAVMTLISFPLYLMGINAMALETGGQSGITTHSMLMGPVAANSFLFAIYQLLIEKKWRTGGNAKIFYTIVLVVSFPMILLSLSRTTILAAIGGLLMLIVLKSKFKVSRFMNLAILIVVAGALTYPVWSKYTTGVVEKNEGSIRAGGITSSREEHWEYRWREFKSSPIIGIGFSSIKEGTVDLETGVVETGNSWLAILSMTGILGFAAFFTVFSGAARRIKLYILKADAPSYCFVGALLAFYAIHMIAEGYIFGAGNFLFFNLWLTIGMAYAIPAANRRHISL